MIEHSDNLHSTITDFPSDRTQQERGTVIPTIPPRNLQEFSTTSIFNAPEDLPKKLPPLGPYVTDENIVLSTAERKLLSKDPKFSLVFPPDRMKLAIEIERLNPGNLDYIAFLEKVG